MSTRAYYQIMFGKDMVRNDRNHGCNRADSSTPHCILGSTAALALLLCSSLPLQAQQIGQKQTTSSGHVVTVYSISWPTPVSSVSAEVEVCAGPKAPNDSFAFPSFFQVHFADG